MVEQFARGADGLFDLPQRRAAIEAERVERADFSERRDLVAPQAGAADEIIEGGETRSIGVRGAGCGVRGCDQ